MFQSQTSGHAKSYFRDALSKADYYINDQELNGTFNGKIAKQLGLEGKFVDKETFEKLCDNINPKDGGALTPRTVVDRRVGYDISYHAPKSVSLLCALDENGPAMQVFRESVHETMQEIEADMQTRVRVQNQYDDRHTGNIIWADFVHQTARPVKDHSPDPHVHAHCFVQNVTWDEVEGKFKAGQFHNIKRDMPYYQARFQKRMADKFSDLGYGIRKTQNGFELAVIPQAAIDHFSKRTNQIGQVAKEKGITNPKALDELGARTRGKKQSNLTMAELQDDWREQLEWAGIDETIPSEIKTTDRALTVQKTIDHAIEHVFSRASVKRDRQILAQGYLHAVDNQDVSLEDIDKALHKDKRVFQIQLGRQTLCTTKLVLKEERQMVKLARDGIGQRRPFQKEYDGDNATRDLGEEQKAALKHILTSQDRLTMIRGGAGTGKTTLIKHAVEEIKKSGKETIMLAPTSDAAHDVLKSEGFDKTDTLARFLIDKELQAKSKNQVIWVDEFGMLGTQDTLKLLEIAKQQKACIITSGDPRQHSAVNRGDAMRILKTVGHIPQASLERIYRQKEEGYKLAVKHISKGDVSRGFEQLDKMGAIKETDYTNITETLTNEYLKLRQKKKSALVISPTRDQMRKINQDIRVGLRNQGIVKKREKTITVYDSVQFTNAQKADSRNYHKGDVIQVDQNIKGIVRGERLEVHSIENGIVTLCAQNGKHKSLPIEFPDRFSVYRKRDVQIAIGDEMRVTKPSFDNRGKRLNNGTILTIRKVSKRDGIIAVKKSKSKSTEFQLSDNFGHWRHAYCSTSYSAQGKTVDHVLINQPSSTFPASNEKQFYVSVSRGREGVTIYTDDKEDLLKQVQKSGDRLGATELIKGEDMFPTIDIEKGKAPTMEIIGDKGYEPEL